MFFKNLKTVLIIEGMNCEHCVRKIKTILESIDGVKKVKVNLSKKKVTIISCEKLDIRKLKEKIESLDYKVADVLEEN